MVRLIPGVVIHPITPIKKARTVGQRRSKVISSQKRSTRLVPAQFSPKFPHIRCTDTKVIAYQRARARIVSYS